MSVKHFFPNPQAIQRFLPCLLGLVLVVSACDTGTPSTPTATATQVPAAPAPAPDPATATATATAQVRPVSDYACTATPSGNNVVLSLTGVRADTENLRINDVWRARLTDESRFTVTNLNTPAIIEIHLRGNGYDGPGGFAVATCAQTPAPTGLELVWSDDFDGTAIDLTKWEVFTGNFGTPTRIQIYSDDRENLRVENGALILEATLEDGQWYSGMVHTNDCLLYTSPSPRDRG